MYCLLLYFQGAMLVYARIICFVSDCAFGAVCYVNDRRIFPLEASMYLEKVLCTE